MKEHPLPPAANTSTPPGPAQSCRGATVAGRCLPKGRLGNAFEQGGCMAMGGERGEQTTGSCFETDLHCPSLWQKSFLMLKPPCHHATPHKFL